MTAADLSKRLVVGLSGPVLTAAESGWLSYYQPSGVILFARNCQSWPQLSALCSVLETVVPGLAIMADHEGGPVSVLARAVGRPPVPFALGAHDDVELTAAVHAETGQRLRAVGVTRVLAPVADVLTESRNPVIGARAFGGDADLVARHVTAAVTGLVGAGLQVCLKHWPGHGASRVDTHEQAVTGAGTAMTAPFAAGLAAGAAAVMVGHLPTGDKTDVPATLHHDFLAASRRQWQQWAGVVPLVVADDVTMGGLRSAMAKLGCAADDGHSTGMVDPSVLPRSWLAALLAAGCDQLLLRGIPWRACPVLKVVEEEATPPPVAAVAPAEFDGVPYDTVRRRSWGLAGAGFTAPECALLWWDLTVGDRWQVAGGDSGDLCSQLLPLLRDRFQVVHAKSTRGLAAGVITRLLVTSHRPLPRPLKPDPRLADHGVCLAMGHPSLAADLGDYLGAGWRVGVLYDAAPEDLVGFV